MTKPKHLNPRFKTDLRRKGVRDQDVTLRILRRARDLIAAGWTRGRLQRQYAGQVRYCAIGALEEAAAYEGKSKLIGDRIGSAMQPDGLYIVTFNDGLRSKKPVLEVFDEAIARMERE